VPLQRRCCAPFNRVKTARPSPATGRRDAQDRVDDAGVPEPASRAMLIAGFGLVGAAMRRSARQGLSVAG
jgi:hypothetical protein